MASRFRLFTKRFFIYSNIVVVFFFLLACLVPYLNPQRWWFISFLGLGFPFLLLVVLFFAIGWLIILRPRYALISGVALLLSLKSISVFFCFSFHKKIQLYERASDDPYCKLECGTVCRVKKKFQ